MEKFRRILQKYIIPKSLYHMGQPIYHWFLAFSGAMIYRFPSNKMFVIGVTGTKGKTTTANLIHHVLNSAGYKTGLSTTVNFKIGEEERINDLKQTMPGRFQLQKLLYEMCKSGCKYAVVETSSEGILQYRHRFIDYNAAVFINLSPEHLERHKSFENYRSAKLKLFKKVAEKPDGLGVYNLDDENSTYFIEPKIASKYGYYIKKPEIIKSVKTNSFVEKLKKFNKVLEIKDVELNSSGSKFSIEGKNFKLPLVGEFNIYNAAAAISVALSQNIRVNEIQKNLLSFKPVPGRMEIIGKGQDFAVIVDYAHEPKSLEAVYEAVEQSKLKNKNGKMICVLGSAGGGRDKWKRPVMGQIAAKHCDKIILTNEDPYDEDPKIIMADIKTGIYQAEFSNSDLFEIIDRKEAIKKAISLAQKGDAVVSTGKGGEVWMCVENNQKIPWDEKKIIEENLPEIIV